jgi:threonine synthase
MKYISTRNKKLEISASKGVLQGISEDGGLLVPKILPKIDNLDIMKDLGYQELAYKVMRIFLSDFEEKTIKDAIKKAYDHKFSLNTIVPIVEVQDVFFLELFHGPTLAFKDMALSILPHLLNSAKIINNIEKEIVILTATSGDTGKAALEGFANASGVKIIVFYPEKGVSEVQKRQMLSQEGDNTFVVGINGNFDDAQNGVKELFNNEEFIKEMKKNNYLLSSANSINIGRLIPQIVYYFYSYLSLLNEKKIKKDEKINIVVPTGNFGNILAAYYAKGMGLPVNRLICASNENNILTEFLNTGVYDKRKELILTTSPSMDILISSNLERLLFHLSGEDDEYIKEKMRDLSEKGFYEIDNLNLEDFYGNYSLEEEVRTKIVKIFKEENYLMDPHTAVGHNVYEKYKEETKDKTKTIIVSTASPFKFGSTVANALEIEVEDKDEFEILELLRTKLNLHLPKVIEDLKEKPILHKNNCNKENMEEMIKFLLKVVE